jgi:hypothetical protein
MGESKKFTVEHNGKVWVFDPANTSEAVLEFVKDFNTPERKLIYVYTLSSRHEGEPIEIYMVNPNWESDEDGIAYVWDELTYSDGERIDDVIDDFYYDALREDLKVTINETWD